MTSETQIFVTIQLIMISYKISHESYVQCSAGSSFFSDDSLDEILALTARHEALMAYYFLDEKNKVYYIISICYYTNLHDLTI